jgi:hypothetical protein
MYLFLKILTIAIAFQRTQRRSFLQQLDIFSRFIQKFDNAIASSDWDEAKFSLIC